MKRTAKFAIVVKTNNYAGNFERQMCAYLTGTVGECEVGKELVEDEISELFENIIGNEPDDNGCYRPVAIGCDIDGFTTNDVVIFFDEKPTENHINMMKERSVDFEHSQGIKIGGFELVEFKSSYNITKL
jgi:hypothetical protein